MSITINQIQYALALSRTGSFSQAAEACFVTQSTLSTMIRKLEDHMDVVLFDRSTKPVRLSKEGETIINQFKIVSKEFENLDELISETKGQISGNLKIGIIPTIAPFILPLILNGLIQSYPEVNFNIYEITTQEIVKKLKQRELDIGLVSLPLRQKSLDEITLFKEDFLVYDARKNAQKKKRYQIDDIDLSKLWLLEEGHCLANQIGQICQLRKRENRGFIYSSGSLHSLLELVNSNEGITLLPRLASTNNKLVNPNYLHPLQGVSPVREIGLITVKSFNKKRLLSILEKEITRAVKPLIRRMKEFEVVAPF